MLSIALSVAVPAVGIARPIQRKAIADKPVGKIDPSHRAVATVRPY
jgi:hypothetical protein